MEQKTHKKVPVDDLFVEITDKLYRTRNPTAVMQKILYEGYVTSFYGYTIALDDEMKEKLLGYIEEKNRKVPRNRKIMEIALLAASVATPLVFFGVEDEMNLIHLLSGYFCLVIAYAIAFWKPRKNLHSIYAIIVIAIALSLLFFYNQETLLMINVLYGCYLGIYKAFLKQMRFTKGVRIIIANACKKQSLGHPVVNAFECQYTGTLFCSLKMSVKSL